MQLIFNYIHVFFFFELTYQPRIFDWVARETTNQFGMALFHDALHLYLLPLVTNCNDPLVVFLYHVAYAQLFA